MKHGNLRASCVLLLLLHVRAQLILRSNIHLRPVDVYRIDVQFVIGVACRTKIRYYEHGRLGKVDSSVHRFRILLFVSPLCISFSTAPMRERISRHTFVLWSIHGTPRLFFSFSFSCILCFFCQRRKGVNNYFAFSLVKPMYRHPAYGASRSKYSLSKAMRHFLPGTRFRHPRLDGTIRLSCDRWHDVHAFVCPPARVVTSG